MKSRSWLVSITLAPAEGSPGLRNPPGFAIVNPSVSVANASNLQVRVKRLPDNTWRSPSMARTPPTVATRRVSETQPSMEALQAVQLSNSNFSAEFGRTAGGLVSLTSRSDRGATARPASDVAKSPKWRQPPSAKVIRDLIDIGCMLLS